MACGIRAYFYIFLHAKLIALLVLVLLALVACGGTEPEPVPTEIPTQTVSKANSEPTPTPEIIIKEVIVEKIVYVEITAVPLPTSTTAPISTSTPASTSTPIPTAEPIKIDPKPQPTTAPATPTPMPTSTSTPEPTSTPLPTLTPAEKKIERIMSEWVPMTVEQNRITVEVPDDSPHAEGTLLDYVLYRIQNPNDEIGYIYFYTVGFDEAGYKLSTDIIGSHSPEGYSNLINATVSPKSESIIYFEKRYWDERKPPYVWDVALKESNSWWEDRIEKFDDLYIEKQHDPESELNIDFLPMKPSDYNIFMVQVDGGLIRGGVPLIIAQSMYIEIFYRDDVEIIDVDPSNNDYFSIDGAFLYNNTESAISAEFVCDVTRPYPTSIPKFPDVEIENISYAYTKAIEVEAKSRADSKEFKASLAPVVEDNSGTEMTTRCHSWSIILRE